MHIHNLKSLTLLAGIVLGSCRQSEPQSKDMLPLNKAPITARVYTGHDTLPSSEEIHDSDTSYQLHFTSYINGMGVVQKLKAIDTTYSYYEVHKMDSTNNRWKLCIIMMKKDKVVSVVVLGDVGDGLHVYEFNPDTQHRFTGVDEVYSVWYAVGGCGYGVHESLLFRKKDQLINAFGIGSFGESNLHEESFEFPKSGFLKDEIWVVINESFTFEYADTNWYINVEEPIKIKKYRYLIDTFKLIHSYEPPNDSMYVASHNGLWMRELPSTSAQPKHLVKKGTKIEIHKTTQNGSVPIPYSLHDHGKIINGHWVWACYYSDKKTIYEGFVFDGYLSKYRPK